jgi:hypothetical protein
VGRSDCARGEPRGGATQGDCRPGQGADRLPCWLTDELRHPSLVGLLHSAGGLRTNPDLERIERAPEARIGLVRDGLEFSIVSDDAERRHWRHRRHHTLAR